MGQNSAYFYKGISVSELHRTQIALALQNLAHVNTNYLRTLCTQKSKITSILWSPKTTMLWSQNIRTFSEIQKQLELIFFYKLNFNLRELLTTTVSLTLHMTTNDTLRL